MRSFIPSHRSPSPTLSPLPWTCIKHHVLIRSSETINQVSADTAESTVKQYANAFMLTVTPVDLSKTAIMVLLIHRKL